LSDTAPATPSLIFYMNQSAWLDQGKWEITEMAGETQTSTPMQVTSRRGWVGAAFGVVVGAVAGWVLGRAVTMAPASGLGATVSGFGVTLGLVVLGFVLAVLVVAGAVMFVRTQRRPMSMAMFAAAAGWVLGYAIALWMV
jgi:hypothetical protein